MSPKIVVTYAYRNKLFLVLFTTSLNYFICHIEIFFQKEYIYHSKLYDLM